MDTDAQKTTTTTPDKPDKPAKTSPRKRPLRIALLSIVTVLAIPLLWYGGVRLYSPWAAVQIDQAASVQSLTAPAYPLRIATYNIAHGRGPATDASNWADTDDRDVRMQRLKDIGALLDDMKADIVVLNEVDFAAAWSGNIDQASVIATAGGYPYICRQRNCDVAMPFFGLRFGNAILSKHPIIAAQLQRFTPYSKLENILGGNHDSVIADIQLPDGTVIAVWAVHLEVRSEETRIDAVLQILDKAKSVKYPLFIAGDFNSTPAHFPYAQPVAEGNTAHDLLLRSGRFDLFRPVHGGLDAKTSDAAGDFTFPSTNPDRMIDWIFVPVDWRILSGRVLQASFSDHLPVLVEVSR